MTNRVEVGSRSSDSQRSVDGGFGAKREYTASDQVTTNHDNKTESCARVTGVDFGPTALSSSTASRCRHSNIDIIIN